jgi:hypothetical protein
MAKILVSALVVCSMMLSCGEDDDDAPPPPSAVANAPHQVQPHQVQPHQVQPHQVQPHVQPQVQQPVQPTGQVMITVAANSTPAGAVVTGGGRQLGTTPLQTQVPVPAPVPGQVQSFAFTFELPGYQTATINASPVNNTISITAALAPVAPPEEVAVPGQEEGEEADDGGPEITVQGRVPDGRIFDNHQTIGTAEVNQSCVIDRLRVRLNGNHTFHSDLHITLRGPNGNYSIQRAQRRNPFRAHILRSARGDQAQGRWTLVVDDRVGQDSGTLRGWSLGLRCR